MAAAITLVFAPVSRTNKLPICLKSEMPKDPGFQTGEVEESNLQ